MKELRELEAAATPGPWQTVLDLDDRGQPEDDGLYTVATGIPDVTMVCGYATEADATFIAAFRNVARELLDVVDAGQQIIDITPRSTDYPILRAALAALDAKVKP